MIAPGRSQSLFPERVARRGCLVKRSGGMTLVELMVGMAVGLFVATVAIATFVSTRTLNVVNASTTRQSENGRLAMELLTSDLRSSGFAGCRPLAQREDPPVSLLNGGIDQGFITEGNSGLRSYHGTGTGFSPALPTILAGRGILTNNDVVSVRVPADATALGVVATMGSTTASPQIQAGVGGPIVQGDVLLIANCKAAAIFQVTSAPATTGVLDHAAGTSPVPGNAGIDLQHSFRSDATVYRLQTRHYYIAPSVLRAGTNSLWRLVVPATAGGDNPAEVAIGVDRLVVTYGVDTDASPDQNVNRYLDASAVAADGWDRVVSARVQMVVSTPDDRMARANQTYRFAGANVTATDRRLRTELSEVVTLRNGAP